MSNAAVSHFLELRESFEETKQVIDRVVKSHGNTVCKKDAKVAKKILKKAFKQVTHTPMNEQPRLADGQYRRIISYIEQLPAGHRDILIFTEAPDGEGIIELNSKSLFPYRNS